MGAFYGDYQFYGGVLALILQAFIVSRIVKYVGLAGVLLAVPVISFGFYGAVAGVLTMASIYAAKTVENATDYSVMNTARQMLWLITRREDKYKAKQAADTFIVRAGDVAAAVLVFVGTTWLGLGTRGFAIANLALAAAWFGAAWLVLQEYRRLRAAAAAGPAS